MDGFNSTNSSELTPIRDGAALLSPSARWVNAPAPDSLYQMIRSFLDFYKKSRNGEKIIDLDNPVLD